MDRSSQVTPSTLHAYEFGWSPDSKNLVFVGGEPSGRGTTGGSRKLYTGDIAGGQPKSILDTTKISGSLHGLQIAVPRWSPDGSRIAFYWRVNERSGSDGWGRLSDSCYRRRTEGCGRRVGPPRSHLLDGSVHRSSALPNT